MQGNEKEPEIPPELSHPFFSKLCLSSTLKGPDRLFEQELSCFKEHSGEWPWSNPASAVELIMGEWESYKGEIEESFRYRNTCVIQKKMASGIGLFLHFLFWSNGQPINMRNTEAVDELKIKPINCSERVGFLLERPQLFHSYIQLCALMEEQNKHFLVYSAKKKR